MKSKIVILLFAIVSIWIVKNRGFDARSIVSWDKAGYYLYLPAVFVYHDVSDYQFYREKGKEYNFTDGVENYGLNDLPNGKKFNRYAIGVAVMQLPFFLIAHGYASLSPAYQADGYVLPYMLAVVLSNFFWLVAGLLLLRSFLKVYFSENVVFLTILGIAFGTNIYYYSVYEQGMSHPYSFFLFAAVLWLTERWYTTFKTKNLLLLGLVMGLVTIVRPVNILVVLIPLLWKVDSLETLKERAILIKTNFPKVLITALIFLLVASIQLSYWKYVTGNWIFYSYGDEGFNFSRPEIIKGLFSYRKGWFVYTPIAFMSFIGFPFLWKHHRNLMPALILFFCLMIYVVFSWKMWYYGGSFGCRPLIETLPLAAIPLSAFLSFVVSKKRYFKVPVFALGVLFIGLNIFQSHQFHKAIIHWDRMTEEYYWRVFGKLDVDRESLKQYLEH